MSHLRVAYPNICSPHFLGLVLERTFPMARDINKTANLCQQYRGTIPLTQSAGRTQIAGNSRRQGLRSVASLGKTGHGSRWGACTLEQNGKTTGVQVTARATDVLRALEVQPGA